jgi:type I restriction enzyme M protein
MKRYLYPVDLRRDELEIQYRHALAFAYDDLVGRDKVKLDIFWLKDASLADADNLPPPDVLAAEIVENLEAALEQFRGVAEEFEDRA